MVWLWELTRVNNLIKHQNFLISSRAGKIWAVSPHALIEDHTWVAEIKPTTELLMSGEPVEMGVERGVSLMCQCVCVCVCGGGGGGGRCKNDEELFISQLATKEFLLTKLEKDV